MTISDCLAILGLDVYASIIDIKSAYRREISKWHPDRFHSDPLNQPAPLNALKISTLHMSI
jgi:DnaJ-class molecular chaperone